MGLFSKGDPCPICGNEVPKLLGTKIEGKTICKECASKVDVDKTVKKNFSMEEFKEYLAFYEENQKLREMFKISKTIDFGMLDTKVTFDYTNKLFCMSKKLDKTIFKGSEITSFKIKEDTKVIFEGSAQGVEKHESDIEKQMKIITPLLFAYTESQKSNSKAKSLNVPEPFKEFRLNIEMNHPYWNTFEADMNGPRFASKNPSGNDYLREYRKDYEKMEELFNSFERILKED